MHVSSDSLLQTLTVLEVELHDPATRRDRQRLEQLLHAKFREIGRSGHTHTRIEVVTDLPQEPPAATLHASGFAVCVLAEDVVLLTYESANVAKDGTLERHALRSSVWKGSPGGWQIVFHQGTPTAPGLERP